MKTRITANSTTKRMLDHVLLSKEAEASLARRVQGGEESARHELVRYNLRLAWSFSRRYAAQADVYGEPEDLFAEGVHGLYEAAKRYDPAKGRFTSYAMFYLRNALRNRRRYVGLRWFATNEERAKPWTAAARWMERTGREANEWQIAAELGWTVGHLRSVIGRPRPVSLEAPVAEEGAASLGETIADNRAIEPDAFTEINDLIVAVRRAVAALDPDLQVLIQRRFGVLPEKSAESPEDYRRGMRRGVSRLEREALARLRMILGGELSNMEEPMIA